MSKRKHSPQRTCIGCGQVKPKRDLIRFVRTPAGPVVLDQTGKLSGRGAYVCPDPVCIERALTAGRLVQKLKAEAAHVDQAALHRQLSVITGGAAGNDR